MARMRSVAEDILKQVERTSGFEVARKGGGGRTVTGPGGAVDVTVNLSHQRELTKMLSQLRRAGWTQTVSSKIAEEDRLERIRKADEEHDRMYGALLRTAETAIEGVTATDAGPGITMTPEVITPERAYDYLLLNRSDDDVGVDGRRGQRRLSRRLVLQLADAMKRNQWRFTHQGIAFDKDGNLVDGQHRLEAVLESDVPIPVAVWRGVDPETFKVLDSGRRRNLSDVLHIQGEGNPSLLGSTLRIIHLWQEVPDQTEWPKAVIASDQILDTLEANPAVRDSLPYGSKVIKLSMTPTAGAAGHFLITDAWPDAPIDKFFDTLTTGWTEGMEEGDPALRLRNYLLGQKVRRTTLNHNRRSNKAIFQLMLLIRMWNADCEGRKVRNVTWKEPFRVPKPHVPKSYVP